MATTVMDSRSAAVETIIPRPMLAYGGVAIAPTIKPPIVEHATARNSMKTLYFHAITPTAIRASAMYITELGRKFGGSSGVGTGGSCIMADNIMLNKYNTSL